MRKALAVFLLVAFANVAPLTALADPITMAWSPVGNPGNATDPATGHGAVSYSYNIGTYDVTVNQYVAFLNSNDPTGADRLGLYGSNMSNATYGGVNYTPHGINGSLYSAKPDDGSDPMNYVTFYDTLRFANWLNNGQTPGSTETGAYTLLGGTPTPSNGNSITRNADATVFLPSEEEWYKAAYYNPATSSYFLYATSSNTMPTASGPTSTPNSANYNEAVGNLTPVGAYTGTTSPSGAYDMAGDVFQWNEEPVGGSLRQQRGGSFDYNFGYLPSGSWYSGGPSVVNDYNDGFRVASILTPEPSTLALLGLGAAGLLLAARRRRASCTRFAPAARPHPASIPRPPRGGKRGSLSCCRNRLAHPHR